MNRIWRIGLWTLIPIFALGLVGGSLYWIFIHKFNPPPPRWPNAHARTALEAQRQDIDYFAKLVALDRSFSPAARREAERRIARLEALSRPLERQKFRVALMGIVALADNGHTRIGSNPGAYPEVVPLRVTAFSDGFYVMRTWHADADLLGGKILSIDGMPIDQVIERLSTLRGGTKAWRRRDATVRLVVQDVLYGAGIAHDPHHSTWTVQTPAGMITRTVASQVLPDSDPFPNPERWLSPEPLDGMGPGWLVALARKTPLAFQHFDSAFQRSWLGGCTLFIQLKSNVDVGEQHISDFLADTQSKIEKHKPCNIILDMRFNGGGDYTNTADFARNLPNAVSPGGRIYLLTSPATFSAAITTTAFVKQAGGNRVTILGETVGDRLAFFAEGNRGCLPNYHLCMNYQTGMHDYTRPCTDWDTCFWLNWFYPVRVKSLDPDETIALSFKDWLSGHDPVLERAELLTATKSMN